MPLIPTRLKPFSEAAFRAIRVCDERHARQVFEDFVAAVVHSIEVDKLCEPFKPHGEASRD